MMPDKKQENNNNSLTLNEPSTTKTCVEPNKKAEVDIISNVVGDFGIWQLRTILIVFLCKFPASWFMACIIFTAPELEAGTEYVCVRNSTLQTVSADQCQLLNVNSSLQRECEQFQYYSKFQSLIMQFDLVCWRDILIAWTQYWHLFGVLAGGVTATQMMNYISPKNVYTIGMIAQIFCGVITGYARDFNIHCIFRCLSAVCCALMFTAGQTIFADITAGVYRLGAIVLYDTFWSIGVIYLPGLAWFFNSWTGIYMGITFPTLILMILLKWTPDSPRWLLKHSRTSADVSEVEDMLRNAAQLNQRLTFITPTFREELEAFSESLQQQNNSIEWRKLWSGHRAKIHMISAHIALSCFIINYMGMLLNIRSFGRDYLVPNTIAMGFSEILGCFLALHLTLQHNKWKWQFAGVLNIIAGGIGCLGWFLSTADSLNDATLRVSLWMLIALVPKMLVSCAQSMLLACMAELMPANKKPIFTFSVVTCARVWLLTAPFLNVLKRIDTALSLTSYCWLSIIGGFFTCFLITPRATTPAVTLLSMRSQKSQESPLAKTVWTVEQEIKNTQL